MSILADGETEFVLSTPDGSLRVRALIAAANARDDRRYSSRNYLSVDWSKCTVCSSAGCIALTRTELRLFGALLEGEGTAVPRERLVRSTWPDASLDRRSSGALQVYIYSLRRRLTRIGAGKLLETVRGVGYRLKN